MIHVFDAIIRFYWSLEFTFDFGRSDAEKVRAVAARSTFPSRNVQSIPASDHFWKFRCGKVAWREVHVQMKSPMAPTSPR